MFKSYITAGLPPAYCVPSRHVSGDGVSPRPKSSVRPPAASTSGEFCSDDWAQITGSQ